MAFGDNGIELELRFWIPDPQEGVNNVRSDVNRAIWRLFKEQGITIRSRNASSPRDGDPGSARASRPATPERAWRSRSQDPSPSPTSSSSSGTSGVRPGRPERQQGFERVELRFDSAAWGALPEGARVRLRRIAGRA